MNDYVITLDIDWAPDWCITSIAEQLIEKKVKATWFVTHASPAIKRLELFPELFELGIHPNFHPDSTQGDNPEDILETLLMIVPGAKSVRTHGLIQSSKLLFLMRDNYNLLYDSSILLKGSNNIAPHVIYTAQKNPLIRIPFFWEDDIEMYSQKPTFIFNNSDYSHDGLKVFNFHPIHVFLNSANMDNYQKSKNERTSDKNKFIPYINSEVGTGSFFRDIVSFISSYKKKEQCTIAELCQGISTDS